VHRITRGIAIFHSQKVLREKRSEIDGTGGKYHLVDVDGFALGGRVERGFR